MRKILCRLPHNTLIEKKSLITYSVRTKTLKDLFLNGEQEVISFRSIDFVKAAKKTEIFGHKGVAEHYLKF